MNPTHPNLTGGSRKGKPGKKYRISSDYDPLATCPPPLRSTYAASAKSAGEGSRKAILRLKCLECCCWDEAEVDRCEITSCALWYFIGREEVT